MLIVDLFEDIAQPIEIPELTGISEKALSILSRLARFHGVKGLVYNRRSHTWFADDTEDINPFVRDAKHITSAAGLGTKLSN